MLRARRVTREEGRLRPPFLRARQVRNDTHPREHFSYLAIRGLLKIEVAWQLDVLCRIGLHRWWYHVGGSDRRGAFRSYRYSRRPCQAWKRVYQ